MESIALCGFVQWTELYCGPITKVIDFILQSGLPRYLGDDDPRGTTASCGTSASTAVPAALRARAHLRLDRRWSALGHALRPFADDLPDTFSYRLHDYLAQGFEMTCRHLLD